MFDNAYRWISQERVSLSVLRHESRITASKSITRHVLQRRLHQIRASRDCLRQSAGDKPVRRIWDTCSPDITSALE